MRHVAIGAGRRRRAVAMVSVVVVGAVATAAFFVATSSSTSSVDDRAASGSDAVEDSSLVPASTTVVDATTASSVPPVCDRRPDLDSRPVALPVEWANRVLEATTAGWGDVQRSISVWVAGYGELVAVEPDLALLPASNEKILTALGARLLLDPAGRFRTEVRTSGDQLVLVAGGDPTLRSHGPHSLAALAQQVRAAGVLHVAGVQVDASRVEAATTARGWQDWQVPAYVGPMSALMVDDNRGRTDAGYLADPALGNAEAFVVALRAAGVRVDGVVSHGSSGPTSRLVAVAESATIADLARDMLLRSDNEIAEALVRTIGNGTTESGVARITEALEPWCLHLGGEAADGSGLSRDDRRSARDWRRLLQVALEQPWAGDVWSGLPVAGRTGTLRGRLTGAATNGNVMAKTGTIIGGSALSGYATTPDGRQVVFSILVNGGPPEAERAVPAIDRLVSAVVSG